jgi:hypothetical protein
MVFWAKKVDNLSDQDRHKLWKYAVDQTVDNDIRLDGRARPAMTLFENAIEKPQSWPRLLRNANLRQADDKTAREVLSNVYKYMPHKVALVIGKDAADKIEEAIKSCPTMVDAAKGNNDTDMIKEIFAGKRFPDLLSTQSPALSR